MEKTQYWENFSTEDLELIKEKDPIQYTLIIERLKLKAKEEKETKKKSIMAFDDFI